MEYYHQRYLVGILYFFLATFLTVYLLYIYPYIRFVLQIYKILLKVVYP